MSKDPAFLFYFRDFLVSTELLTAEEVGLYVRILCHMADKGRLTEKHMQSICKGYGITQALKDKFKTDENGLYYNVRLEEEVLKRCNYTQSRRENAKHMHKHMVEHMPEHMGNGNGNNDIKSFSFTNEEDNQYKQKPSINIKHTINKDNVKEPRSFTKPAGVQKFPSAEETDKYLKGFLGNEKIQ